MTYTRTNPAIEALRRACSKGEPIIEQRAFASLDIGQTFDFIDDANPSHNSFFHRCTKTTSRHYWCDATQTGYRVGFVNARVYHVGEIGR